MVKQHASVRQRIQALRPTRSTIRRTHELANAKPRVLKRVAAPAGAVGAFPALSGSLQDARSPYSALIIKNVTRSAFHHLKSVIAGVSSGATFSARVADTLEGEDLTTYLAGIKKDIKNLGRNNIGTLVVYWEGESSQAGQMSGLAALLGGGAPSKGGSESGDDADWGEQVSVIVKDIRALSPRTKVVVVTPRTALDDADAVKGCEVQDALGWGHDLDADGHFEKAESIARGLHLAVPSATLKAALHDIPYDSLQPVLKYASVLQKRTPGDAVPPLHAAVAEYWQQQPSGAEGELKRYMIDARAAGFDKSYFDAPAKARTFVSAIRDSATFRALNATLPHVLVLGGGHESGTSALAHAIAGELGAASLRVEDVELLELLQDEKGPGLAGILDAANAYGRERNTHVVVYLGQLEALLTLGVKGMHAIGKEPGREHVVVVAAADELGEEMRTRLQPHVHLAMMTTPKQEALQGFWRYYLNQEHPAHTLDDAAIARVAQASAGFYVEEVRQALVQAGHLAFARQGEYPLQITEADVVAACHQASEARRHVQPYRIELTGKGLAGLSNTPPAVQGFVTLLKNYDQALALDKNANKALLLHGAKGVGKLNVARAIAEELGGSLFALQKNEVLHALSDEEVGLAGLLRKMNTLAEQQDTMAVVYLGDIESALGAGANAEESVGFNPVGAQIAKLAQNCGNDPDYKRLVLVAGTSDGRVIESGVLSEAFQATAEMRAPNAAALVDLFRAALTAEHPAHAIDDAGLARIATRAASSVSGFNGGHVIRVLRNASRLAWQRPQGEGPRRLEVVDVLRAIDEETERLAKPSFYT